MSKAFFICYSCKCKFQEYACEHCKDERRDRCKSCHNEKSHNIINYGGPISTVPGAGCGNLTPRQGTGSAKTK